MCGASFVRDAGWRPRGFAWPGVIISLLGGWGRRATGADGAGTHEPLPPHAVAAVQSSFVLKRYCLGVP